MSKLLSQQRFQPGPGSEDDIRRLHRRALRLLGAGLQRRRHPMFQLPHRIRQRRLARAVDEIAGLAPKLLPALGRLRLDHITVQDFERLKARILAKTLSRKRVNNVLNVLSKLLRYAPELELELEIVGKIPIVKTLKVPPQKFDFFTDVELERLIDAAKGEPEWRTAIVLAADAGLWMGEILALEWGDIDLKAGLLTVMRSDWRGQIGSPKGGRARKVPLTRRALAALKAHRHLRGKLVFCWEDGRPWTFVTMRAGMKRQEKRAGLRLTGWHILRHTFCSHLAMRGAAPRAIQALAGHAGITSRSATCTSRRRR
jgi:integrase